MRINYNSLPHQGIQTITPYTPGKSIETLSLPEVIKLASNENPLGCSPQAQNALNNISKHQIATYPVSDDPTLIKKTADKLCVHPDMITLSNGSNALFPLIMTCFALHRNKHILSHEYAFMAYPLHAQTLNIPYISLPLLPNWQVDIDAIIHATNEQTGLILLANPNNPTGLLIPPSEIKRLLHNIPQSTILVLDEAYFDYLTLENQSDINALLSKHPNLIVTRTFSKIYGLAGLRIGYAVASAEITAILKKTLPPFTVNGAAIIAAKAAISDSAFVKKSIRLNTKGLQQIQKGLDALHYQSLPSVANFITFECPKHAKECFPYLLKKGIIIRPLSPMGLHNYLRVSIGDTNQNHRLLDALAQFKTTTDKNDE